MTKDKVFFLFLSVLNMNLMDIVWFFLNIKAKLYINTVFLGERETQQIF